MEPRYFIAQQTGKTALGLSVDGTVYEFFVQRQNIVYKGDKRTHDIKFQSLP